MQTEQPASTTSRRTSIWRQVVVRVVFIVLCLLFAEGAVRLAGYAPRRPANHAVLYEPDTQLGWHPKPGTYQLAADDGKVFRQTNWANHTRATRPEPSHAHADDIFFFGCSFIQGFGLPDDQTLPWLVQQRFPGHSVVNCGTGGYGTYQSLLAMKQRTPKNPAKPTVFIYGFNDFHEARNVADPANLRAWVRRSSTGNLTVPYCTLDDQGNLQAQVFASYPSLPLRRYSAIVALVEDSYVAITGQSRVAQKRAVTERLLLQMQRYCRDRQIQLVVLMQHLNDECKQHYTSFFRESRIDFIDGVHPEYQASEWTLSDGHPNGKMNAYWAELVSQRLRDLLSD